MANVEYPARLVVLRSPGRLCVLSVSCATLPFARRWAGRPYDRSSRRTRHVGDRQGRGVAYYFIQGQGGSTDADLARWESQFAVDGRRRSATLPATTT